MKKSLAPPRRDRLIGVRNNPSSQKSISGTSDERSPPANQRQSVNNTDRNQVHRFQQRYRNKNINILPTQMLVALSGLFTLDISYNKLTDSQIELIMNSCLKLVTFCMQGNQATIIPAAIYKLNDLKNFRHDWLTIDPRQMYESEERLSKLKMIGKREKDTSTQKPAGVNFSMYITEILCISMDKNLLAKIQKCDSTPFAKQNMLKHMFGEGHNNLKNVFGKTKQAQRKTIIPGCFGIFGYEQESSSREIQQRSRHHSLKKEIQENKPKAQFGAEKTCRNIKIEDIRDMCQSQFTNATSDKSIQDIDQLTSPGMPLHKLFSNFDKNNRAAAQIDALLIQGLNPNQYDQNGLSPYHICVINRQSKGLEHLLQISSHNPGFFDLQMPSLKQGRNILHLCVFLKNYKFAKALIQFGLPCDKRDSNGARIQHLIDQNKEFLLLLRKLLKRKTTNIRSISSLAIPAISHENKKLYVKHPQRHRQESRLRITYSRNDKLLQMFEAATGIHK